MGRPCGRGLWAQLVGVLGRRLQDLEDPVLGGLHLVLGDDVPALAGEVDVPVLGPEVATAPRLGAELRLEAAVGVGGVVLVGVLLADVIGGEDGDADEGGEDEQELHGSLPVCGRHGQ